MTTQEAAHYFGSRVKLAAALGITPAAITFWGEHPPITRQYQIEVLSGGALKAAQKKSVA